MKSILTLPKKTVDFVKSVFAELKQVEFPTRAETLKNTNIVVLVSVTSALFLLLVDGLFTIIRNYLTLNV